MRVPEMPLEPVKRVDVGIDPYEDEDRIHELVKRANESINARMETRAAPPADKSRPYRRGEQHG